MSQTTILQKKNVFSEKSNKLGMVINLTGNICSGKSEIAHMIKDKIDISFYSIDQFRVRENDEMDAWISMTKKINMDYLSGRKCIVESSGLNERLVGVLRDKKNVVHIKLVAPIPILLERLRNRDKARVPFPYDITREDFIKKADPSILSLNADMIIDTSQLTKEEIAEKIIKEINFHEKKTRTGHV